MSSPVSRSGRAGVTGTPAGDTVWKRLLALLVSSSWAISASTRRDTTLWYLVRAIS
jgi:hypothetical protein